MLKSKAFITILGLSGLILFSLFLVFSTREDSIPWTRDYRAALDSAESRNQPVLAYLFTDWCGYCRRMEAETFTDASLIQEMASRYVWLKLNAEKDSDGIALRRKFAISGYPAILILDSSGEELERVQGYVPAKRLQTMVPELLSSPDGLGKLREQAAREPESLKAQYELATKYLERGNLEGAISQFKRVLELNSENETGEVAASHYYLALALANQQEHEASFSQLAVLEREFPESDFVPDSILLRGKIHLYGGDLPQAREVLHSFLDRYPDHLYASQIKRMVSGLEN